MDWCKMAVFLYCCVPTHCIADFLSHKWKKGRLIFLHCFLYTLFFIPLFIWFEVDLWWLAIIFVSHIIIDRPVRKFALFSASFFADENHSVIAFGFDQIFHLLVPFAIALIVF